MRSMSIVLAVLVAGACGDTDVANRTGEMQPGQEVEDMGLERDVEALDLDTLAWFREGGTVTFNDRAWTVVGEPMYDPAVEWVGEFEGTPLYAEVGVTPPYDGLYIPLEMDYWQRLEATTAPAPAPATDTGVSELR